LETEGDFAGALDAYREAVSLDPSLAAGWSGMAWVLVRMRRMEEALEASRRATEAAPGDGMAWKDHGILLFRLGRREESVECFRMAVGADPSRPGLRLHLAQALAQVGRGEEALGEARAALEVARASGKHLYGELVSAGHIIQAAGYPQEALEAFEEAMALDPGREGLKALVTRAREEALRRSQSGP
jgi:tetratricopeptide (TPR) repeat protein